MADTSTPEPVAETLERIIGEIERAVVGKRAAVSLVLMGLLADGHVLIEDLPGLAKTLLARSFAAVTSLGFGRVQFTPDLLPLDLTGTQVLAGDGRLEFRPGPVFTNVLLADEVNRAPAKTQAALLEAMQERQVTVDGVTHPLPRPFLVIATQNPIEFEGTYPLPEAQLDRFLLRVDVGYPAPVHEREILERRLARRTDEVGLAAVVTPERLDAVRVAVESVYAAPAVLDYIVAIAAATRSWHRVQVGASPRGSMAMMKLARVRALFEGRDFVTPDDVKSVAVPALAHRIVLRPELWVQEVDTRSVIEEILGQVPAPSATDLARS